MLSLGQRYARAPGRSVLGRQPTAAIRAVARPDGAVARTIVNVGVSTMVESFSRTFLVWLDGRLAADVYVNAANDAQAAEIRAAARAPRGRGGPARRPRRYALAGAPIEVLGLARSRHLSRQLAAAAVGRECLDQASSRQCGPRQRTTGAAPASFRRRPHRGARVRRKLDARRGRIYADYGNPKGQIAVNLRRVDARPEIPLTRMGLRVAPDKIPP